MKEDVYKQIEEIKEKTVHDLDEIAEQYNNYIFINL